MLKILSFSCLVGKKKKKRKSESGKHKLYFTTTFISSLFTVVIFYWFDINFNIISLANKTKSGTSTATAVTIFEIQVGYLFYTIMLNYESRFQNDNPLTILCAYQSFESISGSIFFFSSFFFLFHTIHNDSLRPNRSQVEVIWFTNGFLGDKN